MCLSVLRVSYRSFQHREKKCSLRSNATLSSANFKRRTHIRLAKMLELFGACLAGTIIVSGDIDDKAPNASVPQFFV